MLWINILKNVLCGARDLEYIYINKRRCAYKNREAVEKVTNGFSTIVLLAIPVHSHSSHLSRIANYASRIFSSL